MYFSNSNLIPSLLTPNVPSTKPETQPPNPNGLVPGMPPNSLIAAPQTNGDPIGDEMKVLYKKNLPFDNKPIGDIVKSVAAKVGIDPAMLMSSAFQEGMNKAVAKPNEVSVAYSNAKIDSKQFPVDGFYNYGLDTFGSKFKDLQAKGYLPQGFEQNFKTYDALNDHQKKVNGKMVPDPQKVTTAAFKSNEAALTAKAAMMRDSLDDVMNYAKSKGVTLDDKAKKYFTMAAYNSSPKGWQTMLNEYAAAKDKNSFIDKGQTSQKTIHSHVSPRLKRMELAQQLLDSK